MYNQYNDFVIYDDKFNVVLQNIGFFQVNVNENSKVFSEPLELGSLVSDHQIFELVGIDCDCLASGETMLDDMNELDGFYKDHKKFIIQTKNKTYNNKTLCYLTAFNFVTRFLTVKNIAKITYEVV